MSAPGRASAELQRLPGIPGLRPTRPRTLRLPAFQEPVEFVLILEPAREMTAE